ncbi:hypothetical protein LBMAG42_43140 [Deltaproteobacteria bacterium]|nr:hypothetical protein LBMAG42_43140 [Deltaproteobacteria bacterium]
MFVSALWVAVLGACDGGGTVGKISRVDTPPEPEETGVVPATCELLGITLLGELIPGHTIGLGVATTGDDTTPDLTWTLTGENGDLGTVNEDGTFTLPETVAVLQAEDVEIKVEGCDGELSTTVSVDWPEAERVVVIYNPAAPGSEDVALAYADFRGVPAERLCPVTTTTEATLAGADYPAFVDSVFACATPWTEYIVPVWGVPYKVSDRVKDLAYDTPATVSLDALLFGGPESVNVTEVGDNPAYIQGDSVYGDYKDYKEIGRLRGRMDVWLVSRIDGVSPDAAIALIERTRDAEATAAAGSLDGIVYVDGNRGDTPPIADAGFGSYEWGEWNMWGTRRVFEDVGLYEVVWDGNYEEFGTSPAPTECPDALYYAGWYSYYNYNDCFTWATGAIGAHLDSCSACDIRNPGTWSGSALLDGITATFGAVNEPYVAGMPEYDQFYRNLLQGANFGEAAYESTVVSYWMMVWVGDPLYRPYRDNVVIEREE